MFKIISYFKKNKVAYFFMFPLVLIITLFLAYPILKSVVMSFQDWYLIRGNPDNPFIGLENFRSIFTSSHFINSVIITASYIIFTVIARFIIGLGVALLLNNKFKGVGLSRSLIIIPWAIPQVVAVLAWILMFDKDFGIVNYFLMNLNLINSSLGFLENPDIALQSAMLVNVWKGFPFVAIMLLTGLKSIPLELYEAAIVDGANRWQKFKNITLPMLKPVSVITFLLLIIWTIKDFAIIYLLARGGPSRATETLPIYIYHLAFQFFDFGKAAAAGVVMLLFSLVFIVVYLKILSGGEID